MVEPTAYLIEWKAHDGMEPGVRRRLAWHDQPEPWMPEPKVTPLVPANELAALRAQLEVAKAGVRLLGHGQDLDAVEVAARENDALRARVAEYERVETQWMEWNSGLRARVAELEAMNKMLCGKLDDQRRALRDPCAPYLKDGETPAECIVRNRRDVDIALSSLARDRARVAELEAALLGLLHEDGGSLAHSAQHPKCIAAREALGLSGNKPVQQKGDV